jgi:beta-glucuronidase
MKRHPLHPSREVSDLDGIWNFSFPGDLDEAAVDVEKADCSELMAVPGVFDACPEWAGKRGLGLFKTSLRGRPGKRGLLKFDGLGMAPLSTSTASS